MVPRTLTSPLVPKNCTDSGQTRYVQPPLASLCTRLAVNSLFICASMQVRPRPGPDSSVPAQPGGTGVEVALVRQAHRPLGRGLIAGPGGLVLAGHLEQVRAHRFEPVVTGDPPVGLEPSEPFQAGAGAMGHRHRDGVVQRHDGIIADPQQQVIERQDLRPVGRPGARGFVMHGGDGGLKLVGPTSPRGSAPVTSATPSAIFAWSHRLRSCSSSGTSSPAGPVRAGRLASVSSISASSPATSPSPGSSRRTIRVSRMASADRSARNSPGPEVAAYPSVKIR